MRWRGSRPTDADRRDHLPDIVEAHRSDAFGASGRRIARNHPPDIRLGDQGQGERRSFLRLMRLSDKRQETP
jgi:hypothetical protein